jgi:hypothetical protein
MIDEIPPRLFHLDGAALLAARRRVYDGDPGLSAADQRLLLDVEESRAVGPFSVVDKERLPPSGDAHDYLSEGPYWWPDPEAADGLPWVRRDGEINPEHEAHDKRALAAMASAVNTLAAGYFFSDVEDLASRAGLLLRTWFLEPATRMNPHLRYGQGIPGRCEGRGIGIIDTLGLAFLLDSVGLLGASPSWTDDDEQGLRVWMAEYLTWLRSSEHGRDEAQATNNHGTWYDVQVLALALFTDDAATAEEVAGGAAARLERQLEADGSQPHELQRTRSLSYSVMNLSGWFDLADLCRHAGVDLWSHEGAGGRSLRGALDWLVTHGLESEWIRPQIEPFDEARWLPLLHRGAQRFGDDRYRRALEKVGDDEEIAASRTNLLYPDVV